MSFLYLVIITGWHSSSTVTCAKERWSSKCTSMVTVKSSCGRPPGPCANSLDHFMIFTTSLESLVWVQPSKLVLLESGGRCRNCCSLVLSFGQAAKTLWAGFCYGIPWPCLVCRNSLYYPGQAVSDSWDDTELCALWWSQTQVDGIQGFTAKILLQWNLLHGNSMQFCFIALPLVSCCAVSPKQRSWAAQMCRSLEARGKRCVDWI